MITVIESQSGSEEGKNISDIHFACAECAQMLEAPFDMAGSEIQCPTCRRSIRIPIPTAQPSIIARNTKRPIKIAYVIAGVLFALLVIVVFLAIILRVYGWAYVDAFRRSTGIKECGKIVASMNQPSPVQSSGIKERGKIVESVNQPSPVQSNVLSTVELDDCYVFYIDMLSRELRCNPYKLGGVSNVTQLVASSAGVKKFPMCANIDEFEGRLDDVSIDECFRAINSYCERLQITPGEGREIFASIRNVSERISEIPIPGLRENPDKLDQEFMSKEARNQYLMNWKESLYIKSQGMMAEVFKTVRLPVLFHLRDGRDQVMKGGRYDWVEVHELEYNGYLRNDADPALSSIVLISKSVNYGTPGWLCADDGSLKISNIDEKIGRSVKYSELPISARRWHTPMIEAAIFVGQTYYGLEVRLRCRLVIIQSPYFLVRGNKSLLLPKDDAGRSDVLRRLMTM